MSVDPGLKEHQWWYREVGQLVGEDLMPDLDGYLSVYGKLLVNSFALRLDNGGEEENVGTGGKGHTVTLSHRRKMFTF